MYKYVILVVALLLLTTNLLKRSYKRARGKYSWKSKSSVGEYPLMYLHIPKTGGSSFESDFRQKVNTEKDIVIKSLGEASFVQDQVRMSENEIVTTFRNPLNHVLSMYKHCTEGNNVKNKTSGMPEYLSWVQFWYDKSEKSLSRTIELRHFTERRGPRDSYFKYVDNIYECYVPVNLQATRMGLLNLEDLNAIDKRIGQNLFHAMILENYDISYCILMYKIDPFNIPDFCECEKTPTKQLTHHRHGVAPYNGNEFFDSHAREKKLTSTITDIDSYVYKAARKRMMWETEYVRRTFDPEFFLC